MYNAEALYNLDYILIFLQINYKIDFAKKLKIVKMREGRKRLPELPASGFGSFFVFQFILNILFQMPINEV